MSVGVEAPFLDSGRRHAAGSEGIPAITGESSQPAIRLDGRILSGRVERRARNRDVALQMVIDTGNKYEFQRPELVDLAALCQAVLKDPTKLDAVPKQVDTLLGTPESPPACTKSPTLLESFSGLRGEKAKEKHSELPSPLSPGGVTLAAKELRDRVAVEKAGGQIGRQDGRRKNELPALKRVPRFHISATNGHAQAELPVLPLVGVGRSLFAGRLSLH